MLPFTGKVVFFSVFAPEPHNLFHSGFGPKEPSSTRLHHSHVVFLDTGPDWTIILAGAGGSLGQTLPACLGFL